MRTRIIEIVLLFDIHGLTRKLHQMKKVEVMRGPGFLFYGSNAMGCVINIITRKQSNEGFNANLRMLYCFFDTQKYMVSAPLNSKVIRYLMRKWFIM